MTDSGFRFGGVPNAFGSGREPAGAKGGTGSYRPDSAAPTFGSGKGGAVPAAEAGAASSGFGSGGSAAGASGGFSSPQAAPGRKAVGGSRRASAVGTRENGPTRVSRTTYPAIALCVLGLAGIVWGSYDFLASIDIFGVLLSGASLVNMTDVLIATLSALLVFTAFVLSIRGMVVSRPRWLPVIVFVAALVLPLPVAIGSLYMGGSALKDRTISNAHAYVGKIDPETVDGVYAQLDKYGIDAPGREEVNKILSAADAVIPDN